VRCVLVVNPASGRHRNMRQGQIQKIVDALSAEGHRAETLFTTEPGSAATQARQAAASSADVIFACGGDGTVHEVLQGLVSETETPSCPLGVIPLGSANALARHLRLSLDPVTAALQQLRGITSTIPVGKVVCSGAVRYFTVMAGAGPDGMLVYSLLAHHKQQLGRLAYYVHSARLFATRRFHSFEVEFVPSAFGAPVARPAVSVMATRIDNLGGLFAGLTSPGASIRHHSLHLHILRPPALLSLPLWFLSGWLRTPRLNPFLQCIKADSFSCSPLKGPAPHIEADGEWLGHLPMQVSLLPNALRILMPHS
jgi:diacylglycerol kinase (ATP)